MLIKKIMAILFILYLIILSTGCLFMMAGNETVNDKMDTKHYKDRLQKGYFKGVTKHFGKQYYNYVVPDAFSDSLNSGLEITIPVSSDDKHAEIKTVDTFEKNDNVVYVFFYNNVYHPSNYNSMPYIACASTSPFKEVSNKAGPLDYPTLFTINIDKLNSSAYIQTGKKINITDPLNVDDAFKKHLCMYCPQTGFRLANSKQSDVHVDGSCEWWYWSDSYSSNTYRPMSKLGMYINNIPGFFTWAVLDILTFPWQLAYITGLIR